MLGRWPAPSTSTRARRTTGSTSARAPGSTSAAAGSPAPTCSSSTCSTEVPWATSRLFRYDHFVEERRLGAVVAVGNAAAAPGARRRDAGAAAPLPRPVRRVRPDPVPRRERRAGLPPRHRHALARRHRHRHPQPRRPPAVVAPAADESLRPLAGPAARRTTSLPGPGDLIVMGGSTQAGWEHSVPYLLGQQVAPRISIQWRYARRTGRPVHGRRRTERRSTTAAAEATIPWWADSRPAVARHGRRAGERRDAEPVRRVVTGHDAEGKAVFVVGLARRARHDTAGSRPRLPPALERRRRAAVPRRRLPPADLDVLPARRRVPLQLLHGAAGRAAPAGSRRRRRRRHRRPRRGAPGPVRPQRDRTSPACTRRRRSTSRSCCRARSCSSSTTAPRSTCDPATRSCRTAPATAGRTRATVPATLAVFLIGAHHAKVPPRIRSVRRHGVTASRASDERGAECAGSQSAAQRSASIGTRPRAAMAGSRHGAFAAGRSASGWSMTSVAVPASRSRSIRHVAATSPSWSTDPRTGPDASQTRGRCSSETNRLRSACDSNTLSYCGQEPRRRRCVGVGPRGVGEVDELPPALVAEHPQPREQTVDDGADAGQPRPRGDVGRCRRAEGAEVAQHDVVERRRRVEGPAQPRLRRRQPHLAPSCPTRPAAGPGRAAAGTGRRRRGRRRGGRGTARRTPPAAPCRYAGAPPSVPVRRRARVPRRRRRAPGRNRGAGAARRRARAA